MHNWKQLNNLFMGLAVVLMMVFVVGFPKHASLAGIIAVVGYFAVYTAFKSNQPNRGMWWVFISCVWAISFMRIIAHTAH